MKQEKFNELMRTGVFEQMFIENRINELLNSGELTKEQIDSLIELGKDISKKELERRQKDLASQPGYEEYILSPMVAKILGTKTKKTKSVPEKTVDKTEKMKEKFSSDNLGKAFKKTPSSSVTVKKPQDSSVVSEKKPAQPKVGSVDAGLYTTIASIKISKLRKGDSVATVATKIYAILKNDIEERKQKSELVRNFGDEKLDNERRRHKELLDAIEKAKKKQPKVPVRDPKTGRYVKAEPITPGAPAPKPAEVPTPPVGKGPPSTSVPAPKPAEVPKPAEAPKPVETPKPVEAAKKAKDAADAAEAAKKAKDAADAAKKAKDTATKPPPTPATAPTTTPVRPNLPGQGRTATPLPKMPPLVAGAIFAGTVGGAIAGRMAEKESAGNKPDSYFLANFVRGRDTPGTKTTLGSNKIVKGNIDITTGRPFTKSLNEMTIAEVIELAQRRSKFFGKAGAGAAMGKYQFMPQTLAGEARKVFGPWAMYQPFTEETQELLQQSLMRGNARSLMGAGLPISDANLYMLHFSGNVGMVKRIMAANDTDSMTTILSPAAVTANPDIAKMSVGEYKRYLAKTFNMKQITFEELTKDINISTPTGRTEDYKKMLMNNREDEKNNTLVNINAPTTVINKQNPKQSISKPTPADKPAIAGIK